MRELLYNRIVTDSPVGSNGTYLDRVHLEGVHAESVIDKWNRLGAMLSRHNTIMYRYEIVSVRKVSQPIDESVRIITSIHDA